MKINELNIGNELPFILIAGPCAIESLDDTLFHAEYIKKLCLDLNIPLIFKSSFDKANRTSISSNRGFGIDEGLEMYGRIDGVVNNAGSFSWQSMSDSKLEDFKEVIDVNLTGSFLGLKYGTEAIRLHGEGGSIVMISSVLGKVGAPNTTAVCAAKGGVRLLALSLIHI